MQVYDIKTLTVTAGKDGVPITVCSKKLKTGEVITSAVVSKHRKTMVSMDIKITHAALVLDMLAEKQVAALRGKRSVIVEYNGNVGEITESEQHWTEKPTGMQVLVGDIIYTIQHSENDELRTEMKKIAGKIGNPKTADSVALFCDSYFNYRKASKINAFDDLIIETAKAAFRKREFGTSIVGTAFHLDMPEFTKNITEDVQEEVPAVCDEPEAVLKEAKKGKFQVAYQWKEEQKEYIYDRKLLDSFVPTDTFVNVLKKIRFRTGRILKRMEEGADRVTALGSDYINLTLTGKPGTGKTAMVYAISAATGLPVYTTAGSHNTDEDEFEGKTKMVDGKPSAVPTDALKCFEDGGIFLIEEANLPQAAVIMGALGQAVEFPFILKKNGYETIRRHPLCIFVTTMNVGTVGAKAMSQPFANRFKQSYVLNDPDRNVFINILKSRTGEDESICEWIYSAYESVLKCLDEKEAMADVDSIKLALSMRSCIGAIENIQEGSHPKDALRDSIIGKIAEQDLEMAEICQRAVDAMPSYRRKK